MEKKKKELLFRQKNLADLYVEDERFSIDISEVAFINTVEFDKLKYDINFKNAMARINVIEFLKKQICGFDSRGVAIPYDLSKTEFDHEEEMISHYSITSGLVTTAFEAAEQFLKAFLVSRGTTWESLKDKGHNLQSLYDMLDDDIKKLIEEQFNAVNNGKSGKLSAYIGNGVYLDLPLENIKDLNGKTVEESINPFNKRFYLSVRHPGAVPSTIVYNPEGVEFLSSFVYALENVGKIAMKKKSISSYYGDLGDVSINIHETSYNISRLNVNRRPHKNNIYLIYAEIRKKMLSHLIDEYGYDYLTKEDDVVASEEEKLDNYVARCYTANVACDACEHLMKGLLNLDNVGMKDLKSLGHNLLEIWNKLSVTNPLVKKIVEEQFYAAKNNVNGVYINTQNSSLYPSGYVNITNIHPLNNTTIENELGIISRGNTENQLGVRSRYAGSDFISPQNLEFLISFTSALNNANLLALSQQKTRLLH